MDQKNRLYNFFNLFTLNKKMDGHLGERRCLTDSGKTFSYAMYGNIYCQTPPLMNAFNELTKQGLVTGFVENLEPLEVFNGHHTIICDGVEVVSTNDLDQMAWLLIDQDLAEKINKSVHFDFSVDAYPHYTR